MGVGQRGETIVHIAASQNIAVLNAGSFQLSSYSCFTLHLSLGIRSQISISLRQTQTLSRYVDKLDQSFDDLTT